MDSQMFLLRFYKKALWRSEFRLAFLPLQDSEFEILSTLKSIKII